MIFNGGSIERISSHHVGNKSVDGRLILTKNELVLDDGEDRSILTQHFLDPLKDSFEVQHFNHELELSLHELQYIVKQIFDDQNTFHEYSKQIAQLLFGKSVHPKINPGDFYVVLFKDCIIDGEVVQALGVFKFEVKQKFLKSGYHNETFSLSVEDGIAQKKIDKGALIFDVNQNNGYKVILSDKKSSQGDAQFWAEEFLKTKPISTAYSETQSYLALAKDFVTTHLPETYEINKAEQVDLLNKSVNYFKTNTQFNEEQFATEILGENEGAIAAFKKFKDDYQTEREVKFTDGFDISDAAVKKTAKVFKRVIKLDKNFDVHIHGDKDLIERGIDPVSGRKFYKIYFDQEF